jgi:hypothetical protein
MHRPELIGELQGGRVAMDHISTDLESIIRDAAGDGLDYDVFCAYCASQNQSFDAVCNTIALTVAKRFHDSTMSYWDADGAANAVFALMIERVAREPDAPFAQPAFAIYEAFDAGEFDRGDGTDSVERFTRPVIKKILDKA